MTSKICLCYLQVASVECFPAKAQEIHSVLSLAWSATEYVTVTLVSMKKIVFTTDLQDHQSQVRLL